MYTYYFTTEASVPLMKCEHAEELSTAFNRPEGTVFTGRSFDEFNIHPKKAFRKKDC